MGIETEESLVSVVVPAHQAMDVLDRCLQALMLQSVAEDSYEVIVVDNGENEGIEALVANYPRARCIQESTPGSYVSRNAGIASARGQVLAFTDADCVPDRKWIEEGLKLLRESEMVGVVGGRIELELPDVDDSELNAAQIYEKCMAFNQKNYVETKRFAATANMLTTRRVIDVAGRFDERLYSGGDLEFGNRVADAGFELRYADAAVVRHRSRSTLQELMRKARRLAGGEIKLAQLGIRRLSFKDRLNMFIPPFVSSWRLLKHDASGSSLRFRLVAIGTLNLLFMVKLAESLAIWFGKEPAR